MTTNGIGNPHNSEQISGFALIWQKLSEFGSWLGRGITWIRDKCCCRTSRVDGTGRRALSSAPAARGNPAGMVPSAVRNEIDAKGTAAIAPMVSSAIISGIEITVKKFADPFAEVVDVVVNAANDEFRSGGAGTNAALTILAKKNPFAEAQAELAKLHTAKDNYAASPKRAKPGIAVLTSAGDMQNARYMIQALAPDLRAVETRLVLYCFIPTDDAMNKAKLQLHAAYFNALSRVNEKNEELRKEGEALIKSILFPSLGTGIFGWQAKDAAPIAMEAFKNFAAQYPNSGIERITLSIYSGPGATTPDQEYAAYEHELNKIKEEYEKSLRDLSTPLNDSGSSLVHETILAERSDDIEVPPSLSPSRRATVVLDPIGQPVVSDTVSTASGPESDHLGLIRNE